MKAILQELRTVALAMNDPSNLVRWETETMERQLIVDGTDIYQVAKLSALPGRIDKMLVALDKLKEVAIDAKNQLAVYALVNTEDSCNGISAIEYVMPGG